MFKKRGVLITFIKLFINNIFFFLIMNGTTIFIKSALNKYFNKNYVIDYTTVSIWFILLLSAVFSIMMLGNSKNVTKAIRIDERTVDENRINDAMEDMKWRMKDSSDEAMNFISPLSLGIFRDEISVRFVETEIYITGPHRHVENMIRIAKFPYASFEIIANKQYLEG